VDTTEQERDAPWQKCRAKGLDSLRAELAEKRYASVKGSEMRRWLDADLALRGTSVRKAFPQFKKLWDECPPQVSEGSETIYEHKHVFHSLYDLDGEQGEPTRMREGIVTGEDGMRRQRYVAHETTSTEGNATPHYVRYYPALPDKWDQDPVVRGLRGVFSELCSGPNQEKLGIKRPHGNTIYQFCYRTIVNLTKGDPGPEGVHVDGGTAAMIVVVRRDNLKPGTGGTRIWKMEQGTGKPTPEDVKSGENILHTWTPEEPLEALFFLDESVLHEALRGMLQDESFSATRDMFILDVRRRDGAWKGPQPGKK